MLEIYKKLRYIFFVLIVFLAGRCNLINQPVAVPTYIHIDSFAFIANTTNPSLAVSTHQITNVWVYYNNNVIGTFDLPCTVPVIATGTGTLELEPGISIDGLNDLVGGYTFYKVDTFSFLAQPGKIITHEPQTAFSSDVVTNTIANFTYSPGFYNYTYGTGSSAGQAPITFARADSFTLGGIYGVAGSITLTAGVADSSVDSSVDTFAIPSGLAYIELDYKCDVAFAIGLQANEAGIASSTPYYFAGVYPNCTVANLGTGSWNKFYLSVADFAAQYPGTSYNLFIKTVLPSGQSTGRVLLDNIQLVHF